jgi:Bacterial Ig-like domain (group 3)
VTLVGGVATLDVTPTTAGQVTYVATYAENAGYVGSSASLTYAVQPATTAVVVTAYVDGSTAPTSSAAYGQAVTLKATVSLVHGAAALGGTVTFYDGATAICSAALEAVDTLCHATLVNGAASYTTDKLAPGFHSIRADYDSGNPSVLGETGRSSLTIGAAGTGVSVTASPSPSDRGQSVAFTVTVCPALGRAVPSGLVSISIDDVAVPALARLPLGVAVPTACANGSRNGLTFNKFDLPVGTHTIKADYTSDDTTKYTSSWGSTTLIVRPVYYKFTGFFSPLGTAVSSPAGSGPTSPWTSAKQKLGSVVPLKWKLQLMMNGSLVTVTQPNTTLSITAYRVADLCAKAIPGLPAPASATQTIQLYRNGVTAGGSGVNFDTSGNSFVFSWDTSKASVIDAQKPSLGCYEVVVNLDDGSSKGTMVQF